MLSSSLSRCLKLPPDFETIVAYVPLLIVGTRHDRYLPVKDALTLLWRAATNASAPLSTGLLARWGIVETAPYAASVRTLIAGWIRAHAGRPFEGGASAEQMSVVMTRTSTRWASSAPPRSHCTLEPVTRHWRALGLVGLAVVGGCGSSTSGVGTVDASIGHHLLRGVAQIRATHDRKKLHAELTRVLASLHRDHGSTPAARRARELAIRGFESTLRGVRSQLDFSENDSGEVEQLPRGMPSEPIVF